MVTLGYCCQNLTLGTQGKFRTITQKRALALTATERYNTIQSRTRQNFENLLSILHWNVENNIRQYRVSSDLVVFATHEANNYNWLEDKYVTNLCSNIKRLAEKNQIRLSIHPSQFCVIATEKENVLKNTIKQLSHEADICDLLGIKDMCIHVGSKRSDLFIENFKYVPERVIKLIRLENDRSHSVEDILNICYELKIPMILDFHHHSFNPTLETVSEYMEYIIDTWNGKVPIMHISSSANEQELVYAHHDYISDSDYQDVLDVIGSNDIALEFECKKKDLALLKFL